MGRDTTELAGIRAGIERGRHETDKEWARWAITYLLGRVEAAEQSAVALAKIADRRKTCQNGDRK